MLYSLLPLDIVRHIYTFDDNLYYKKMYNHCILELNIITAKDQICSIFDHWHRLYSIFAVHNRERNTIHSSYVDSFSYYAIYRMKVWGNDSKTTAYIPRTCTVKELCNLHQRPTTSGFVSSIGS